MKDSKERWQDVKNLIAQDGDLLQLGSYYSYIARTDIKHIAFTISRYKFVSKLFLYKKQISVCELGCQEGFGALMFQQNNDLKKYVGIDLDEDAISWNKTHLSGFQFIKGDLFDDSLLKDTFDVVYSLDVIEHIEKKKEEDYCKAICRLLKKDGVAVVGTPNMAMQPYGNEGSKIAHINLFDQSRLHELMFKYFHNVFIFNMNDEVVNQGFAPMSCYIFAVCSMVRD